MQTTDKDLNKTVLITVWSVTALVLTSCFSGGVLQSIVNRRQTSLDTIEDVVNAKNISVAIRDNTWIWWQFHSNKKWNASLDNNMLAIKHLVKVVNGTDMDRPDKVLKRDMARLKDSRES